MNSLVKLIMLASVLLKLHFNVLYCINRLMQCNVQIDFFIFPCLREAPMKKYLSSFGHCPNSH